MRPARRSWLGMMCSRRCLLLVGAAVIRAAKLPASCKCLGGAGYGNECGRWDAVDEKPWCRVAAERACGEDDTFESNGHFWSHSVCRGKGLPFDPKAHAASAAAAAAPAEGGGGAAASSWSRTAARFTLRRATRWATGWNAHCRAQSACTPNKDWTDHDCGQVPCQRMELRQYLAAMPKAKRPLLMWDAVATKQYFENEVLRPLQFPDQCKVSKYLTIDAFNWGLLSQVRDFADQLMAGLYYNRTVVLDLTTYEKFSNNWESAFLGCKRPYLECFFPSFSSCTYNETLRDKGIRTKEEAEKLGAHHWPFTAWVIPHTGKFFPEWLWNTFVRRDLVRLHDGTRVRPASANMFEGYSPDLVASMKTSMLRSLLVPAALTPLPPAIKMADEILGSQPYELPMLAIHIRRTDKTDEDPYYAAFHKFLPTKYFFKIARQLEEREGVTFKSVFIMTDTPGLVPQIKKSGVAKAEMRGDPTILHNNWFEVQKKLKGAAYMKQFEGGYKHVSAEVKRQYQFSFLAEVFAAARHSSYVLGSGSSGVGQIIAQSIAARTGVDPNMFGIWTEDWLTTVVPELAAKANFDSDTWLKS